MVFVNNNWERVDSTLDALKIIEENLGKDFAETLAQLILDDISCCGGSMYTLAANDLLNYLGYKY